MTTPAMPTPFEFLNQRYPGPLGDRPKSFSPIEARDMLAARDSQWSAVVADLRAKLAEAEARPRVSRVSITRAAMASGCYTFSQWMALGADQREHQERVVCRAALAMDVKWPVETVADNDAYALQHDPNKPDDKETTMDGPKSLRAKLKGEIAVNGEPLSATPPRPDLSKWPDGFDMVEWDFARNGEWYWNTTSKPCAPVKASCDHEVVGCDKSWVFRRRTPAPPAPASDDGEVERLTRLGMAAAGRKYSNAAGYDDCDDEERGAAKEFVRAVLAAIPKRVVDVEEAAKAAYEAFSDEADKGNSLEYQVVRLVWNSDSSPAWNNFRASVRPVIHLCGCVPGERKADDLIDRLKDYMEGLVVASDYALLGEAIERLRGEGE